VDELQNRVGEGPCLDAIWREPMVRVDDMVTEHRWPHFVAEVADLGVGSMLCFRLFVGEDSLGALNLYAHTPCAFDADAEAVGLIFASHASVALVGAQQQQRLRSAMDHRDLVGQAKGILMERYRLTADQAFAALVQVSSTSNRKLIDIAVELTDTGDWPAPRD
jgi:GAF domain-containing protein